MTRSEKYFKLCIYLVIVALINIAGRSLFFRLDLTANKVYSISNLSRRVVSTLSEPLTVKVFFTKNLPAPHNNTERYLHDLLDEYAIHANRHFNYQFYDVSPEEEELGAGKPGNQKSAQEYGIHPVQIRKFERDEIKFINAYMGIALIHGDIIETIPAVTSTDGLEYRLTTTIQKMNNKISALLALKDKITIQLFLSSSLKEVAPLMGLKALPELPEKLAETVNKLNAKNYGKLAFNHVDPSKDNAAAEAVKTHKLMSLKWPDLSGGRIPAGEGTIGLIMTYGQKTATIPLLSVIQFPLIGTRYELVDMKDLDTLINDNVESLVDINEKIGYLADHDTLQMKAKHQFNPMEQQGDGLGAFNGLLSQNYSVQPITLKKDSIPESLKCLVIARPTEKLSDFALYQIDQFLMRGRSIAVFLDAFKEVMAPNQQQFFNQGAGFVPVDTGLEKLLAHYGVSVRKSYVMDENCYKQMLPQQFGGGERALYFAPVIKRENINEDLPFMKNVNGLIAMRISPLALEEERLKSGDVKAQRLLASSDKAWEMKGRINLNPMFIQPPREQDKKSSMPLAYLLSGRFQSFFDGKPIPEKPKEEKKPDENGMDIDKIDPAAQEAKSTDQEAGEKAEPELSKIQRAGDFLAKSEPAKIFIISSAEMLKDNMLDEEGKTPNATFLMNVIDALNGRDEIAAMRSKEQGFNPLYDTDALVKTGIKVFNIVGMPVLVILFGFFVWLRRQARRKQIQMIFQK